jgi:predicted metal-binding membrane protein
MDSTHPSITPAREARPRASVPRFDRIFFATAVALIGLASWIYLVYQGWAMEHMDLVDMSMPGDGPWAAPDLLLVFTMWAIMMVGMMLPSVAPLLVLYRRIVWQKGEAPALRSGLLLSGYLLAWTVFSLLATLGQWALHDALVLPSMQLTSARISAVVLILAGVYQWTPFKVRCLARCRSPMSFLLTRWRAGAGGALAMGLEHGLFCIGCCWLLMAVLFVVGMMNLWWIVAITIFVLVEKMVPASALISRVAGVLLVGWGVWLLLHPR